MGITSTLIIGGGISGLSTAWFLRKKGVTVRVLESRPEVGGSIATTRTGDYLIEHGPNSTLKKTGTADDALGELVEDLGLEDRLVVANQAADNRFVLKNGKLISLPTSPGKFLSTPLFSMGAKLRLGLEPFIGRGREEESIAQFVKRRLGQEFLDYSVDPFISGVYAGDPNALSVQAATPKIYALEQQYGSLVRGAMARGKINKGAGAPQGQLVSFQKGMGELPCAIASKLPPGTVITGRKVTGLERAGKLWRVYWENGEREGVEEASRVILSLPAHATAQLLAPHSASGAKALEEIQYAPVATVALGFAGVQVTHPLDGFGFLIPRKEGVRLLGALFSSTLFPDRAKPGRVLITTFMGGSSDPGITEMSDGAVVERITSDLSRILGIQGEPDFVYVTRYRRAIPQYRLGHLALIKQVDEALQGLPGLFTRANWREGISVSDCVLNGRKLAEKLSG